MGIPAQCVGSSLVAAGAIAGTLALHEQKNVPKACVVGSQVALATVATLAVHHVDPTKLPHAVCIAGTAAAAAGAGYAAMQHPSLGEELKKIPKECYISTVGGIVLVVVGAMLLSRK